MVMAPLLMKYYTTSTSQENGNKCNGLVKKASYRHQLISQCQQDSKSIEPP